LKKLVNINFNGYFQRNNSKVVNFRNFEVGDKIIEKIEEENSDIETNIEDK